MSRHIKSFAIIGLQLLWLAGWLTVCRAQPVAPLPNSHAHNDYLHRRPLLEALRLGYQSIEIDVYPVGNRLVVSHLPTFLWAKKDIEQLYFQPLADWMKMYGRLYQDDQTDLIWMIDIKREPERALVLLQEIANKYSGLVIQDQGSEVGSGKVRLLLSGARPASAMPLAGDLVGLDGAFAGSDTVLSEVQQPRCSAPYGRYFKWKGEGKQPEAEAKLLAELVAQAHRQHKTVRFYHCPEVPAVWATLLDAGVDWINVDDLTTFASFRRALIFNKQ